MKWNEIQANWGLFRRRVKQRWHRLTDEQLNTIAGQRARLVHCIGSIYQLTEEESERQLADWLSHQRIEGAR